MSDGANSRPGIPERQNRAAPLDSQRLCNGLLRNAMQAVQPLADPAIPSAALRCERLLELAMADPSAAEQDQAQRHAQGAFRRSRLPAFDLTADRVGDDPLHASRAARPLPFKARERAAPKEPQPAGSALSIAANVSSSGCADETDVPFVALQRSQCCVTRRVPQ